MGVAPADCVVIEDSPAGIAAAKRAGMRVFAFTGGSHAAQGGPARGAGRACSGRHLRRHAPTCRTCSSRRAASNARIAMTACRLRRRCRHRQRARRHPRPRRARCSAAANIRSPCNQPRPGHAEHDSEDIWRAVCAAVRRRARRPASRPEDGRRHQLRRDLLAGRARPRRRASSAVSTSGERRWDTIVWLDHRALAEADECTATGHRVLDFIGGVMSPEMADAEADVAEAAPAATLGASRLSLRPRRLPDLAASGSTRPLAMHADLQMDLSRA